MDIQKAKEQVVLAGKMLIEKGLIARTWGNISCRINEHQFVITPSGKAYETLSLDDVVLVNIEDLTYEGDVKPSSEKGIHAEVYKHMPDVNFVIHTHQINASIISTLKIESIPVDPKYSPIGSSIPVAEYALPGTKKLRKNVSKKIKSSNSKAIIMAKHGALYFGKNLEEAFTVASELEKVCEDYMLDYCNRIYNKSYNSLPEVNNLYLEKCNKDKPFSIDIEVYDSERIGNTINLYKKNGNKPVCKIDIISGKIIFGEFIPESKLHRLIYQNRPDIKFIIHSKQEDILTVSKINEVIYPLLDDFAQIIGPSMKTAKFNTDEYLESVRNVVKALNKNNGVFLQDNGALCCGPSKKDAHAAELVTIKECKAWILASIFEKTNPINKLESSLMHFVYKSKYSKEATN